MTISSIVAIYFLFFVATAFVTLSIGVRTDEEAGTPKVAGQADSAPHHFDLARHLLRAALIAMGVFALYYANWAYGWIRIEAFDFFN